MTKVKSSNLGETSPIQPPQGPEEGRATSEVRISPVEDRITPSDEIVSSADPRVRAVTTPDQPNIFPLRQFSSEATDEATKQLKETSWLSTTFLAAISALINGMAHYETLNFLSQAKLETKLRDYIFQMAKSNSELTKALYEKQSEEKRMEAFNHFASATISAVQFVQTMKNKGVGTKKVDDDIAKNKTALEQQGLKDAGVTTGDNQQEIQRKVNDYAALGQKSDEYKALEKKISKMELKRDGLIEQQIDREDRKTQNVSDTIKQTVQGIGSLIQSGIKSEQGQIDALKQLQDGFIQAFTKYSDTSAHERDSAQSGFERYYDFITRLVDSVFRYQSLSHSG